MPIRVQTPSHGIVEFPDGTDQATMARALQSLTAPPKGQTASGDTFGEKMKSAASMLGSLGMGALKGAAHRALDAGEMMGKVPNIFNPVAGTVSDAVDTLYGKPGLSRTAMAAAREDTAYQNMPERIGGAVEGLAELAVPVTKGVQAVPTTAKAGKLFQEVMGAAKSVPVDLAGPGDVALRIADLAQRGGGTNWGPAPVRQFIQWATDPKKEPMTYEVARDFASNISRLSADEMRKLPPAIGREVHGLRVSLNKAVGEAAARAGKGQDYVKAMNDYAKAKRLQDTFEAVKQGVVAAVPKVAAAAGLGGAGAAGYWAYKHLLGGD